MLDLIAEPKILDMTDRIRTRDATVMTDPNQETEIMLAAVLHQPTGIIIGKDLRPGMTVLPDATRHRHLGIGIIEIVR